MVLLGTKPLKKNWHRQIELVAGQQYGAVDGRHSLPWTEVHLSELRRHTSIYLQRRKLEHPSEKCDVELAGLIDEHASITGARRDVGIIACFYALSQDVAREILRSTAPSLSDARDCQLHYLHTLALLDPSNSSALTNAELRCAKALIALQSVEHLDLGRRIRDVLEPMGSLLVFDLLPLDFLRQLLQDAFTKLRTHLQILEKNGKMHAQYLSTRWLHTVPRYGPRVESLVDDFFPTWRIIRTWSPDQNCLGRRESLADPVKHGLSDLLAMEGPDLTGQGRSTLRQGLFARLPFPARSLTHGQLRLSTFEEDVRQLLDRLVAAVDTAMKIGPDAIYLMLHFVPERVVDTALVELLEAVYTAQDVELCRQVLKLLSASSNSDQMTALMQLLPYMDGNPAFSRFFDTYFQMAGSMLRDAQTTFCRQIQAGRPGDILALKIFHFGKAIRDDSWLSNFLSADLKSLIDLWPSMESLERLFKLKGDADSSTTESTTSTSKAVNAFLLASIGNSGTVNDQTRSIVDSLIHCWSQPPDSERQRAALAISNFRSSDLDLETRHRCLKQVYQVDDVFISATLPTIDIRTSMACVVFADALVSTGAGARSENDCWQRFLLCKMKMVPSIFDETSKRLGVDAWFKWIYNLKKLGWNRREGGATCLSPFLNLHLLDWNLRLAEEFIDVLRSLEEGLEAKASLGWVFLDYSNGGRIRFILKTIKSPQEPKHSPFIQYIMRRLFSCHENVHAIYKVLLVIGKSSDFGISALERVMTRLQNSPQELVETMMAALLQCPQMTSGDIELLKIVASIHELKASADANSMQATTDIFEGQYAMVLEEAQRLDSLRVALDIEDPQRTEDILKRIGIDKPLELDHVRASVPPSLVDVIEVLENGEMDLCFPLTHIKGLRRKALGVGLPRALLVHVSAPINSVLQRFTISCRVGQPAPNGQSSLARVERMTYQLDHEFCRILSDAPLSLEVIYQSMVSSIESLAQTCVVCGKSVANCPWRSTTCDKPCSISLRGSSLDVRLADLRIDPSVVDLLLATVYATSSSNLNLLPECPVPRAHLANVLWRIPAVLTLQGAIDLTTAIKPLGPQVEALLSWVCTRYRGFLTSAVDHLRVPAMPSVHQFLLASAAPELERTFAQHFSQGGSTSRVVFHGTTLDRVYPILCEGLKVLSNSPLMRNAAAHGRGVYLADEPSTSWGYTTNSGPGWAASSFHNFRVLLGCELAGAATSRNGIYVLADESRVMVRYVFLCPANFQVPEARHIVPAMQTTFASLRSGSA